MGNAITYLMSDPPQICKMFFPYNSVTTNIIELETSSISVNLLIHVTLGFYPALFTGTGQCSDVRDCGNDVMMTAY